MRIELLVTHEEDDDQYDLERERLLRMLLAPDQDGLLRNVMTLVDQYRIHRVHETEEEDDEATEEQWTVAFVILLGRSSDWRRMPDPREYMAELGGHVLAWLQSNDRKKAAELLARDEAKADG